MLNILPVIIFYLIISAPIYGQQNSLSVVRACDFDGSGVIDIGDFLLFVDSFGTNEEKYDLDGDGAVAVSDFLIFVDYFGKVVPPATEPVLAVRDTLDLSNTGIKMLTKEQFKQYPGVKVLILDDNEISVIEAGAFDGMNSVERIFARRNQISEIPDSLFYGLGALRAVDFTENPGVPFPLALRLQRTVPDTTLSMPATLTVSWPIALPIDWKHLVFVRNLHQGNRIDVAIPARMHEKAFTFGDWDTEVAGWRYSPEDEANSNPPYRMFLELRNHHQYKVTYGVNSHEGTGLYGFRLVIPDTLCLYAACSGEDFAAPSRGFAGGGGGGAPTQPDPSSPPSPPQPPQNPDPSSPPSPSAPKATIAAGTSPITEGANAVFTVRLSPAPSSPVTVAVDISQSGSFINGSTGTRTVVVGTSGTVTLSVATNDDSIDESNGQIRAQIVAGSGYTGGFPSQADVFVNDNDEPLAVTIEAGTSPVTEGTDATFTLTISPAPSATISVKVSVTETGNMISGTPPATVILNSGETTATLTVQTVGDNANEDNSSVTARLQNGTGYTVGSSSSATVVVNDDDTGESADPSYILSNMRQSNRGNIFLYEGCSNTGSGQNWHRQWIWVNFKAGSTVKVKGVRLTLTTCNSYPVTYSVRLQNSSDEDIASFNTNVSLYCNVVDNLYSVDSSDGFITLEKGKTYKLRVDHRSKHANANYAIHTTYNQGSDASHFPGWSITGRGANCGLSRTETIRFALVKK